MSEPLFNENEADEKAKLADQREKLKQRASALGIEFAPNISSDKLAKLVEDHIVNTGSQPATTEPEKPAQAEPVAPKGESVAQRIRREAMKLVRVRITVHNPNKQQFPGELFTVSNEFIGTVSKYVPFGQATEQGYHIENCIYQHMKARKYLHIETREDRITKRTTTITRDVPEFSIEVLPPLTKEELQALRDDQRVRNATGD